MKHSHLIRQDWLTRAIEIRKLHLDQCRSEDGWTLEKTAVILNRSIGSVSQDILIAKFFKTHEKQLRRCSSMRDALNYIKDIQKEMLREDC